jgi:glyceraldehyde 3-phosphate dehydrogenase
MSTKVAINGFGRIGRLFLRAAFLQKSDLEWWRSTTSPMPGACLSAEIRQCARRLARRGHAYGRQHHLRGAHRQGLVGRGNRHAAWRELGVDVVAECTARYTERPKAAQHHDQAARKVVISAPAKDPGLTVVLGVNDAEYDPSRHHILSSASCTTNCLAPVAKVMMDSFGIEQGFMSTVHAYTNDQRILDLPHKDLRRARAAAVSIIPTSTGAARAIGSVIPELKGKLDGFALRVPIPDGSVVDLTLTLEREASIEEINAAVKQAAEGPMAGVLRYTDEPIVSSDIVDDPHSSIFDSSLTMVMGRQAKMVMWYDNEWGFTNRMVELCARLL